ncbi:phosphatase PAP2 family protein [Chryseomicrobium aureum]|uniref:phosphatase PAP2 family protein n=1 Tax=Chryseomicrobium aureum TaxID=1441723 RepID=UPI001959AB54|nr:phosphatase PAP2 family protein [Chryseomicrobium aureum]MBM7706996.1 undecaprenyl-diphosphatase [Chryseomicrobium aureum]
MKQWKYILALPALILFFVLLYFYIEKDQLWTDQFFQTNFEGNRLIGIFSVVADPPVVLIVSIVLVVYLWFFKQNFRGMMFVLLAVGGGSVMNRLLKTLIERERPELEGQLLSFSFPSGHSMIGLIYLFTIAYFLTEYMYDRKKQTIIWSAATLLTILIGLSRVANIHHFGSDVVAGWAFGYFWFAVVMWWYERRERQFKKRRH